MAKKVPPAPLPKPHQQGDGPSSTQKQQGGSADTNPKNPNSVKPSPKLMITDWAML